MIQLANDPNARRSFPAAANEGKAESSLDARKRNAHAWPFLSRFAERPSQRQHDPKPAANDSGS